MKKAELNKVNPWYEWLVETILLYKYSAAKKYKYIYFHDLFTYNVVKHLIPKDQKVIFQPHSPELISQETKYTSNDSSVIDWVKNAEISIFEKSDILVFPNKGAQSIYKYLINENQKISYILSGCLEKKESKIIPIDQSSINFIYVGRRTNIKGFDKILNSFKEARKIRNDIKLFLLGNGEKNRH